jgi:hypothetical protein
VIQSSNVLGATETCERKEKEKEKEKRETIPLDQYHRRNKGFFALTTKTKRTEKIIAEGVRKFGESERNS